MVSSRCRGKKRTEDGFTVLEIVVGSFLALILVAGAMAVHSNRSERVKRTLCAERAWRWLQAGDEIESELRRWEMLAPQCLSAGLEPLSADGSAQRWTLLSLGDARPTIRPQRLEDRVEIPASHYFASGQTIAVCDANVVLKGKIRAAHASSGETPSVLEVDFEDQDFGHYYFSTDAVVASFTQTSYSLSATEHATERVLISTDSRGTRRRIASGFSNFDWRTARATEAAPLSIEMVFSMDDCELRRSLLLSSASPVNPGQWLLGERQLFLKPWVQSAEGGSP